MTESKPKFRTVNATLGKQPSFGPFPADQLMPWMIIAGGSYFLCYEVFKLNWIWTGSIAVWLISTWWVLTANGSWRILSKFIATPYWTRVRAPYQRIRVSRKPRRRKSK